MVRVLVVLALLAAAVMTAEGVLTAERRKLAKAKKLKLKFLPAKLKKGRSWWSSSEEEVVEEAGAVPQLELAPLSQYPVWKVHKYKGLELRPVLMVDAPPSVPLLPEPVAPHPGYAPAAEYLPPHVPAAEYGPPHVPAPEYGSPYVPAAEYGPPPSSYIEPRVPHYQAKMYEITPPALPTVFGEPPQVVEVPAPTSPARANATAFMDSEEAANEEESMTAEDEDGGDGLGGLDALSNLGALTSLLGSGDGGSNENIERLQAILRIIGTDATLLERLQSLKNLKLGIGSSILAAQARTPSPNARSSPAPLSSALYIPPAKAGFLSSLVPSFLRSAPGPIPLPPLPEVAPLHTQLSDVTLPDLPAVRLSPYGEGVLAAPGPYVKVQYAALPPRYHYSPQPLFDSYGAPLPSDAYAAPSEPEPIAVPAPASDEEFLYDDEDYPQQDEIEPASYNEQ